jgi:UDP-N-acetylmuramoylalanine--D-glutamate ligase
MSSNTDSSDLKGAQVLVMGLGAHGGGAATARYCAGRGARVTVTDLRTEEELGDGLASLSGLDITYVLGEHREEDFASADLVVKNPAVRRTSPYLRLARRIETDISLFLAHHAGPVYAVTGTKGKSTVASALHYVLSSADPSARLGGNITVSPLSFAHELSGTEPVVLELSSFQLGDLLLARGGDTSRLPPFAIAIITNLLPDHQDYYHSMDSYAADKALIFQHQRPDDWVILSADDPFSRAYAPPRPDRCLRITAGVEAGADGRVNDGAGILRLPDGPADPVELVPPEIHIVGEHQRCNLLFAGAAAYLAGVGPARIRDRLAAFPGIAHRLEHVGTAAGIAYYNDSAATIPEAAESAVASFDAPVHLIAGGSDKGLSLDAFTRICSRAASTHLLAGSATPRIASLLREAKLPFGGPHDSLRAALDEATAAASAGEVVLLSPGCASFGMFRNEFDRGDQFRLLVDSLA